MRPVVPRKPYARPEAFNPKITLLTAPKRFFELFSYTREEVEDMIKENVYAKPIPWDEVKIHAACSGMRSTTAEYELQRLELGTFHDWDADPRIYSFHGRFA